MIMSNKLNPSFHPRVSKRRCGWGLKGVLKNLMLRKWSAVLLLFTSLLAGCQHTNPPAADSGEHPATTPKPVPPVAPLLAKLITQDGAKDATAEMRLQLEEADGSKAQLEFQIQRKISPDRIATFLKVNAPREDSDKALLAFEKPDRPTEAYSYLAGLKKLAKLSSSNTLSFHNSKVTVQELLGMEFSQYTFGEGAWVKEGEAEFLQVEGKAKPDRNLAYPRVKVYFTAETLQPARFEVFDERNELLKTMRVEELKTIQNHQTLMRLAVEEHLTKRKVRLETRAIKYDQQLADKIFTEDNLKALVTSVSLKLAQ
jgi:hypothetical protein